MTAAMSSYCLHSRSVRYVRPLLHIVVILQDAMVSPFSPAILSDEPCRIAPDRVSLICFVPRVSTCHVERRFC